MTIYHSETFSTVCRDPQEPCAVQDTQKLSWKKGEQWDDEIVCCFSLANTVKTKGERKENVI